METEKKYRIAVVPGSYDPVTIGHLNIIRRTAELFDEVRAVVFKNSAKKYMFTEEQRFEMLKISCRDIPNVKVELSEELLADYVVKIRASAIVKGVRNNSDFEYESWLASINHSVDDSVETLFLPSHSELSYINSTVVRELLLYGKNVEKYVPKEIFEYIHENFRH